MAVAKMELINVIGPIEDFERIILKYMINRDIHIENIFDVLHNVEGLVPFEGGNAYGPLMKLVDDTAAMVGLDVSSIPDGTADMTLDELKQYWESLHTMAAAVQEKTAALQEQLQKNVAVMKQMAPIRDVDISLHDLFNFKFVKVRFGKLPWESYEKMISYLQNYDIYFLKCGKDQEYVFGAYFAPAQMVEKIDGIFSSLYFQRTWFAETFQGTPAQAIAMLEQQNEEFQKQIDSLQAELTGTVHKEFDKIGRAYRSVKYFYEANEVRKFSGHTSDFFYIAGWIPQRQLQAFRDSLDADKNIVSLVEDPEMVRRITPPTKLRNFWLFRPFQRFVEMYGLPAYNELDPTPLFAVTYTLMFGMMYGDIGHGFVLALLGFILARKKNFLGPILEICGCMSMVFGAVFSSIFGFENLFWPALWEPMNQMMPTLIASVAMGTVIITAAMVMNILNGIRQKDAARVYLDPNGLAGLVFYWAVIAAVLSALHFLPQIISVWYIILFVAVPLVVMFLKEPLSKLLAHRRDWMPESKGGYILETFFEMFELLLSYITNTISFIRVGAFALNHAGMMSVVFTLAKMAGGGSSSNLAVIILGNVVVLGLEGLLVAIQVLRLQFYELFSRYYSGTGRPFRALGK